MYARMGCLLVILVGLPACIPVPFASPPVRAAIGVGKIDDQDGAAARASQLTVGQARFALAPMQLMPTLDDRVVDLSLGYLFEGSGQRHASGPFAEVALRPWFYRFENGRGLRAEVSYAQDLLLTHSPGFGDPRFAGAVTARFSYTGYSRGEFESCAEPSPDASHRISHSDSSSSATTNVGPVTADGVAWGESSIGWFVSAAYRRFSNVTSMAWFTGISFDLPASVGLAYFWNDYVRPKCEPNGKWTE